MRRGVGEHFRGEYRSTEVVDKLSIGRTSRVREVKRELHLEQALDVIGGPGLGLKVPGASHLVSKFSWFEAGQVLPDLLHHLRPACHSMRDHVVAGISLFDGVRKRDERTVGMPEHCVPLEPKDLCQRTDVPGVLAKRER